jgi:hypothetical protein
LVLQQALVPQVPLGILNTFAASYLNTQG